MLKNKLIVALLLALGMGAVNAENSEEAPAVSEEVSEKVSEKVSAVSEKVSEKAPESESQEK